MKSIILFILLIINILLLLSCKPQERNNTDAEKSIPKIQTADQEVIDSSFTSFLSHFQEIKLPHEVKIVEGSFEINPIFGIVSGDSMTTQQLIADYYVRNFLAQDSTTAKEFYLSQYQEVLKDHNPWFYLRYGEKFALNDSTVAILYHSYYQPSAANGGTYFDMLATFDTKGKAIDWANIAEQVFYKTTNLEDDSINITWEGKMAVITCNYEINKRFSIKVKSCKKTLIKKEIWAAKELETLGKNQDKNFTHQYSKPAYMKQKYQILPNGKIKKVSENGSKDFKKLFD